MVYVFGAGGHAKVIIGTLIDLGISISGIFDDQPTLWDKTIFGAKVLGPIEMGESMSGEAGIIGIGDNRTRFGIAHRLIGWNFLTLIHPHAWIHSSVKLGPGTVVFSGAVIQPDVKIGSHCIINTGATVDHDCFLEDFVHIAPGTNMGGNIHVDEGVFIGIGGTIIPGINIGRWAITGAGSVIIHDVSEHSTVVGVPAKKLRTHL